MTPELRPAYFETGLRPSLANLPHAPPWLAHFGPGVSRED